MTDEIALLPTGVRRIAAIVAPTTLVTALLFYFGWAWTDAEARYLGLDESLMGFSTADYLLRSVSTLFLPLMGSLLVALFLLGVYGFVDRRLRDAPASARVATAGGLAAVGIVLVAIAAISALVRADSGNNLVVPLLFAVGTAAVGAAFEVGAPRDRPATREQLVIASARRTFVFLIVALSLFWEVSIYAQRRGVDDGERLVASLPCRPDAVLYSDHPLLADAPGITDEVLPGGQHRYSGLKLLLHTKGRYFLIAEGWSTEDGRTVIVHDDQAPTVELRRTC